MQKFSLCEFVGKRNPYIGFGGGLNFLRRGYNPGNIPIQRQYKENPHLWKKKTLCQIMVVDLIS